MQINAMPYAENVLKVTDLKHIVFFLQARESNILNWISSVIYLLGWSVSIYMINIG